MFNTIVYYFNFKSMYDKCFYKKNGLLDYCYLKDSFDDPYVEHILTKLLA